MKRSPGSAVGGKLVMAGLILSLLSGCAAPPAPRDSSGGMAAESIAATQVPPTLAAAATAAIPLTGSRAEPVLLKELQAVAPVDVIREMYVFGGGGGPGDCIALPQDGQVFEARQPDVVVLRFCWEGTDTYVRLTATSPDRGTEVSILPVKSDQPPRYLDAFYQVDLSRPAGSYNFRVEGLRVKVSFTVNFAPPNLPVFYEVYEPGSSWHYLTRGPSHRLQLAGFAPNEPLRLLVYQTNVRPGIKFLGWQPVAAGPDGKVWVDTNFEVGPEDYLGLSVSGPLSGEVLLTDQGNGSIRSMLAFQTTCPQSPPSRLTGGEPARALSDGKIYEKRSTSSTETGRFARGERILIYDGPYCSEGALWWYFADLQANQMGYVRETSGQNYLLEPAP